ncbi:MAG: DMT family transporter [Gammaproteobacteria bacterium]|nr:DMT family transporter [Gammaproteobacteria bacterium]
MSPSLPHASNKTATLLIAISAALYGLLAFFGTKLIHAHLSVENMLFWRFIVASAWMVGYSLFQNKKRGLKVTPTSRDVLFIFLLGGLCYSGSSGFYFVATHYMGTGLAMVIFFSYPVIVAFFALLMDRASLNWSLIIALMIMLIGLWLLRGQNTHTLSILGVMYAILASLSYAIYVFGTRWRASTMGSDISTIIVCLGCATTFLILTLINHSFAVPQGWHDWFYVFALSILTTAIPIQLMLEGLKRVSALRASVLSSLEPLVTVAMGIGFLNETISVIQAVGCFLILFSALAIQLQGLQLKFRASADN